MCIPCREAAMHHERSVAERSGLSSNGHNVLAEAFFKRLGGSGRSPVQEGLVV